MKKRNPEAGNVLFYILIAVALLGALSFAVSNSNRGNITQLSEDRARLLASEIVEYAETLATTVAQLRLRGCADTEISFENNISAADFSNPNAPSDESCHVFSLNGGGVTYQPLSDDALDPTTPAPNTVSFNSGFDLLNVGSDESELIAQFSFVNEQVCLALNTLSGIDAPTDTIPREVQSSASLNFQGTYGATPVADTLNDENSYLDGQTAFCRFLNTSERKQFIRVLIAR